MSLKSKLLIGDVRIFKGTPSAPLTAPALFLRLELVRAPGRPPYKRASLSMARPAGNGYMIKELMADMGVEPEVAIQKSVDIARRGNVKLIYLNANLDKLPRPVQAAG